MKRHKLSKLEKKLKRIEFELNIVQLFCVIATLCMVIWYSGTRLQNPMWPLIGIALGTILSRGLK